MTNDITHDTVHHLVNLQHTGNAEFFEAFWADVEAFVERSASSWLRSHAVVGVDGCVDQTAVDDVKQGFVVKVLELPKRANQSGWFDHVRFGWEPDRLRGWIYRVVRNVAVDYCKQFRHLGKKSTMSTFGDLELNHGETVESVLKPSPKVDFDAFELQDIVAECLGELTAEQRALCHEFFVKGLSQRDVARGTGVSAPTVCRHWQEAADVLRAKLLARGVDASWLNHAA